MNDGAPGLEELVAELEAVADGLIKLGYTRGLPVAFILPATLTGGKQG